MLPGITDSYRRPVGYAIFWINPRVKRKKATPFSTLTPITIRGSSAGMPGNLTIFALLFQEFFQPAKALVQKTGRRAERSVLFPEFL